MHEYSLPWPLSIQSSLSQTLETVGINLNKWTYKPNSHLFSSQESVIMGVILYFSVIFGLQRWMKFRQALTLKWLFVVHNVILVVVSAVLLWSFVEVLGPMIWQHGWYYAFCHEEAFHPQLEWLYYANYLVKWYELLDTVFLVLKKKPLGTFVFSNSDERRVPPSVPSRCDNGSLFC
jgi:fatty acid elongase 3